MRLDFIQIKITLESAHIRKRRSYRLEVIPKPYKAKKKSS